MEAGDFIGLCIQKNSLWMTLSPSVRKEIAMPEQDSSHDLSHSSRPLPGQVGTWRLMPNQALGIRTRRPGQILVVHGQAWITWDAAITAHPARERDHVVSAGEVLFVPAHARVVLESTARTQSLDFEWRTLPAEAFWRTEVGSLTDLWSRWTQAWRQVSWLGLAIGLQLWRRGAQGLRLA